LLSKGVTDVAMESPGEIWKAIFNILENNFEVLLVNAQQIKQVPGRQTDVKDAEWIAERLRQGLLKASFIPAVGHRELTRHRPNFVHERATWINRVQKTLESGNIKLASVAPKVMGVCGRAMLAAIVEGKANPAEMAELAKGRLREKREPLEKALEGQVKAHPRFGLTELFCQIDSLDESSARFELEIEKYCRPFEEAVKLLDTLPGGAQRTAEVIVSEIGTAMSRFPTADPLAAWAGGAPGNNESAGKRDSGTRRPGNKALNTILVQAAQAASHTRNTYWSAQYHRLAGRRGKKRASGAGAHSILVIAYNLNHILNWVAITLTKGVPRHPLNGS
jgi:transposase